MLKRILIIEDDPVTLKKYVDILSKQFMVETAADGLEGFNKVLKGGYDLILLDAVLPTIDGFTILDKVKKSLPQHPNGPILFMTNLIGEEVVEQCLSKGAAGYLMKIDITKEKLIEQVRQMVGSKN
jgi:CheY-like chemotaxis protein